MNEISGRGVTGLISQGGGGAALTFCYDCALPQVCAHLDMTIDVANPQETPILLSPLACCVRICPYKGHFCSLKEDHFQILLIISYPGDGVVYVGIKLGNL